jgi:L-alanine-DL-glutamate epimerase-like enolase superfamily enzyme
MKITKIECNLLDYPLPAPLQPSWAPGRIFNTTGCTLISVHTDEGITGYGASPDLGRGGFYTIPELVAPYILGMDPFQVERISPYLRNASRDGGYPWALEVALWDIIGKASNQPVYRLWGAYQNSLPAYASLAEVPEPDEQIRRLYLLKEMGFRAVKLRLRRPTIKEDIQMVEKVRQEFGDDLQLMVDANQSHTMPCPNPHSSWTYQDAFTVAREMHRLGVLWLEEPLPRYNLKQLAKLTASVEIPIAGGELNIALHEYRTLIEENCYDIIQADCAFSEGVFQLRKVAGFAEMSYKKFIPHTWSNGINLGANLHLAASLPNCPWLEFPIDPPAWTIQARDFMLTEPYVLNTDGSVTVSDNPGMGYNINHEAISRYSKNHWISDEDTAVKW